jgi:ketosteroid isomerase-like protein
VNELPSHEDRAQFLKRFERFGSQPSVETYLALFHPEAVLFDDGMERPIGVAEIPAHIADVLALVKGFRMQPERWRARGDGVMVEAHNRGEVAGRPVSWRAVYRIELEGSLVRNGRRYFDRAPLLAALDPNTPSVSARLAPAPGEARPRSGALAGSSQSPEQLVLACADAWAAGRPEAIAALYREDAALDAPGLARPLGGGEIAAYYARLAALLGGARLTPRRWAGDDTLLFVEWQGELATPAGPHAFGAVERFDLAGGRVLAARHFFETGALARALGAAGA